ncbi:MAG: sigma-70 family RNA polymerase sigma factor [Chloroflexota bacterium]|nr:sigma-70 family RNA polymerase sigma factor [Chloroflexota bacterium]
MTDYREWVLRAKHGNKAERDDAFDHLVRDFQGMVYSLAYGRLSDRQLAEDAAQEALLAAYKQINQLQNVAAFPLWLRRIVLTQTDRIQRRRRAAIETIELSQDTISGEPSPEALLEASELREKLRAAVAALPEIERDVTRDYYFEGETQREISERLNIPLATVKKRLQYARQHLRGLISGFNETLDRAISGDSRSKDPYQPAYVYIRQRRRRDVDRT